jgi:hypothetical protein
MATVVSVYTVDPYVRTPDDVLAALFSSEVGDPEKGSRPKPKHKRYTAKFSQVLSGPGDDTDEVSGTCLAMVWAGDQIENRHQQGQTLVRLMDGQHSLWDEADRTQSMVPPGSVVEILDVLHAASYVWSAAKVFCGNQKDQAAFAKDTLRQILEGKVRSVIRSFRWQATHQQLKGKKRKEIDRVCGYLDFHRDRMNYDEYLALGYPIATGVIEGACRHIVKDRMERSGMKWTQKGAQELLHLRCLRASGYWGEFHNTRATKTISDATLNC